MLLLLSLAVAGWARKPQTRPASKPEPQDRPASRPEESPPPSYTPTIIEVEGKNVEQWKSELKSQDPSRQGEAIVAATLFGTNSGEFVPLLIDRSRSRDVSVRTKAVIALRMVYTDIKDPRDPPDSVSKIVDALARRLDPYNESQIIVRYEAARSLVNYAPYAGRAIPTLVKALDDRNSWEVRQTVATILRRAGWDEKKGPDPRVTRAFHRCLTSDPCAKVRLEATIGLGAMGKPSDPMLLGQVINDLKLELPNHDKKLVIWAHVSLVALDQKSAASSLKSIVKLLEKHEDPKVRAQAALALGVLGTKAKSCADDLVRVLNTEREGSVVVAACNSLGQLGVKRTATAALLKVASRTERKDMPAVSAACGVLMQIQAGNQEVANELLKLSARPGIEEQLKNALEQTAKYLQKPPKEKEKDKN